jgi:exodeoxyribonuclease VII large subunit
MRPAQSAISVSELNRQVKALLEQGLAKLWVEGEISNLARPQRVRAESAGESLAGAGARKALGRGRDIEPGAAAVGPPVFQFERRVVADSLRLVSATASQIRCAWFRQRQRGPTINLENGDQVLVFGRVSIYEARGDYQLIVEQLEDAGEGELRRRFEALKKKLSAEGLFDEEAKQDLPGLPGRIGVVTSPSGAAIRDIITVLNRRFPSIPVLIYPTLVQGETAATLIADAIATAVTRDECDVLIVARGGGSLEDLWSFNEEIVARAIYECPIPVVSAVGHEVDFTIADFVADVRAPTPSGAAELVVPDQAEWLRSLNATAGRIALLGRRYLEENFQTVDWLSRRLMQSSPAATVARQSDWLRNLQQILNGAIRHDLATRSRALENMRFRLLHRSPRRDPPRSRNPLPRAGEYALPLVASIASNWRPTVHAAAGDTARATQRIRDVQRGKAENQAANGDTCTGLRQPACPTLDRGYAIVSDEETGAILTDAAKAKPGSDIRAQLAHGTLKATVKETSTGKKDDS